MLRYKISGWQEVTMKKLDLYDKNRDFYNLDILTEEFQFKSSNGVNIVRGYIWKPIGKVKGIIQISHGMCEYVKRYDEFARYLAKNGYVVVGNDHLGHGSSAGSTQERGYFGKVPPLPGMDSGLFLVKDLHQTTKMIKSHFLNIPYIIIGHSMGSFVLRRYLSIYGKDVDGAIILGTGNKNKIIVGSVKLFANIMEIFKGDRFRSKLINNIIFGSYNKRIDAAGYYTTSNKGSKNSWLTTDEYIVNKYNSDENCNFIFTLNAFDGLFSLILSSVNKNNIKKIPKNLPVFIGAGQEDPVGNYGREVKKLYKLFKACGISNVELKLYEGCRHEILNERIRKKVYSDLLNWIDKVVDSLA